jgi:hypothetical protein
MWKSLIPGIHVDSDLDEEDKQKDEAHVFLVVKTKATTRNEEDELELKIPVYENLAYVRKEIYDVCHGQDADPITFTEDLMATTPMNIIVDKKKVGTTTTKHNGLGLDIWAMQFKVPLFEPNRWYLQLPMTVDYGGGKRVSLTEFI